MKRKRWGGCATDSRRANGQTCAISCGCMLFDATSHKYTFPPSVPQNIFVLSYPSLRSWRAVMTKGSCRSFGFRSTEPARKPEIAAANVSVPRGCAVILVVQRNIDPADGFGSDVLRLSGRDLAHLLLKTRRSSREVHPQRFWLASQTPSVQANKHALFKMGYSDKCTE